MLEVTFVSLLNIRRNISMLFSIVDIFEFLINFGPILSTLLLSTSSDFAGI